MSYSDDLAAFVNAVVEEKTKELLARKSGKPVPGGMGSSLGGVTGESDGIDGGEDGDDSNEGMEKLTDRLKTGDKPEKFKLFDCESGDEVTLDGIGGNGIKPIYPTGFEDCKDPNEGDDPSYTWYHEMRINAGIGEPVVSREYTKNYDTALAWIKSQPYNWTIGNINNSPVLSNGYINGQVSNSGGGSITPSYKRWTIEAWNKNITPPPEGALETKWPAVDKNHLVWNDEKQCFEPLCGELNTQVSGQYSACNDEMILCDEEGNKVKVEIDGDEMKVTQSKFNQEAIIKNGKVQSTKSLTAEQTARAFK